MNSDLQALLALCSSILELKFERDSACFERDRLAITVEQLREEIKMLRRIQQEPPCAHD